MDTSRVDGVKAPRGAEIAHREDLEFVFFAPLPRADAHVRIKRVEGGHDGLEAFGRLFGRVMFAELALGGLHLSRLSSGLLWWRLPLACWLVRGIARFGGDPCVLCVPVASTQRADLVQAFA